ncbi:hypothetical protein AQUCO_01800236v1 [Aquilegia coerulea]|uniref:MARVEL domain-containing protein n=1 Tax=Aquilegia coerulea TaxID=218851 RepID=A0A2G5DKK9_AQUCA|nr:hypothetical protein AQUCO_01800236v1 [Aquilegia coerulea]PIA44045.1 hypothetical protein AQUCO_01800236v1 [Aquilegia coerulea]PIA44046.1 hypothetical protein AQUCO_01800236v1 [Aquilegia coerulea]
MNTSQLAISVAFLGCLSFLLGVIAENKKPAAGLPIGKDITICKFPSDPTVALGSVSFVALIFSAAIGLLSVFYPYGGVSVPKPALFKSIVLHIFFWIASICTVLGGGMMLWATITEGLHHVRNVHHTPNYACPTAKTGLFGGAAFISLDASLLWLVCLMLTHNARADYLDEADPKGDYGEVLATMKA